MENKKQDVNSLEELVKTADSFRDFFANLADELSKVLADIKVPKKEEDTWEMKCPYKKGDEYWLLDSHGEPVLFNWNDCNFEKCYLKQGNTFKTKEAAELEAKRRNLLTRFRAFRDECNGNWKINWDDVNQDKHIIKRDKEGNFLVVKYWTVNEFNLFGYFKDYKDAKRAIELFGDEIIELFVEGE